jgi:hypothetical protein
MIAWHGIFSTRYLAPRIIFSRPLLDRLTSVAVTNCSLSEGVCTLDVQSLDRRRTQCLDCTVDLCPMSCRFFGAERSSALRHIGRLYVLTSIPNVSRPKTQVLPLTGLPARAVSFAVCEKIATDTRISSGKVRLWLDECNNR